MGSRFHGTSATLASIRGRVPRFHSAELGGTTAIADVIWTAAEPDAALPVGDAEGEASTRRSAMYRGLRLVEDGGGGGAVLEAIPGMRVFEERTALRGVGGQETFRTELLTLSWTDPAREPGTDNSGQVLVARFAGPVGADDPRNPEADGTLRYHVICATGNWVYATDLFSVPDGPLRRLLVGVTPNEERVTSVRN